LRDLLDGIETREVERELRGEGINHVLLVPAIAD
jgi:hypothetical protein